MKLYSFFLILRVIKFSHVNEDEEEMTIDEFMLYLETDYFPKQKLDLPKISYLSSENDKFTNIHRDDDQNKELFPELTHEDDILIMEELERSQNSLFSQTLFKTNKSKKIDQCARNSKNECVTKQKKIHEKEKSSGCKIDSRDNKTEIDGSLENLDSIPIDQFFNPEKDDEIENDDSINKNQFEKTMDYKTKFLEDSKEYSGKFAFHGHQNDLSITANRHYLAQKNMKNCRKEYQSEHFNAHKTQLEAESTYYLQSKYPFTTKTNASDHDTLQSYEYTKAHHPENSKIFILTDFKSYVLPSQSESKLASTNDLLYCDQTKRKDLDGANYLYPKQISKDIEEKTLESVLQFQANVYPSKIQSSYFSQPKHGLLKVETIVSTSVDKILHDDEKSAKSLISYNIVKSSTEINSSKNLTKASDFLLKQSDQNDEKISFNSSDLLQKKRILSLEDDNQLRNLEQTERKTSMNNIQIQQSFNNSSNHSNPQNMRINAQNEQRREKIRRNKKLRGDKRKKNELKTDAIRKKKLKVDKKQQNKSFDTAESYRSDVKSLKNHLSENKTKSNDISYIKLMQIDDKFNKNTKAGIITILNINKNLLIDYFQGFSYFDKKNLFYLTVQIWTFNFNNSNAKEELAVLTIQQTNEKLIKIFMTCILILNNIFVSQEIFQLEKYTDKLKIKNISNLTLKLNNIRYNYKLFNNCKIFMNTFDIMFLNSYKEDNILIPKEKEEEKTFTNIYKGILRFNKFCRDKIPDFYLSLKKHNHNTIMPKWLIENKSDSMQQSEIINIYFLFCNIQKCIKKIIRIPQSKCFDAKLTYKDAIGYSFKKIFIEAINILEIDADLTNICNNSIIQNSHIMQNLWCILFIYDSYMLKTYFKDHINWIQITISEINKFFVFKQIKSKKHIQNFIFYKSELLKFHESKNFCDKIVEIYKFLQIIKYLYVRYYI